MGIVQKSGTWYSYNDEKLGQGREKARDHLKENPAILADIDRNVRQKLAELRAAAIEQRNERSARIIAEQTEPPAES